MIKTFCVHSPNAIVSKDHFSDISESLVTILDLQLGKGSHDVHSWQHFNLPQ